MPNKKIIVTVSNDFSNDQRVHKVCNSLQNFGYEVCLTGVKHRNSPTIKRTYKTKRFSLMFNRGVLFYACLNFRLFWYIIFNKCDIILSNDLDTLAGTAMAKIIKGKKLIYDSHELFTEVPELENKRLKKYIWKFIEKTFIKQASAHYTVCKSIADYYDNKYNTKMRVICNLPLASSNSTDYEKRKNILLYQGTLNTQRGIEIMIDAMQFADNYQLMIAGKGYMEKELKDRVNKLKLNDRVKFTGNLDFKKLKELTQQAKIGFSLEQGNSLNYKYSLPNKIFDYIQSGVPVICSNLPEMKEVINKYKVGKAVNISTGEELAEIIKEMLSAPQQLLDFHNNCITASKELNWEKQEIVLKDIFT